jgi:hypothetical protein
MRRFAIIIASLPILLFTSITFAADFYFKIPFDKLQITQGQLPQPATDPADQETNWNDAPELSLIFPYAILDTPGEAFIESASEQNPSYKTIAVHTTQSADVTGRIFFANPNNTGISIATFHIPLSSANPKAHEDFLKAKQAHYDRLFQADLPGAAWFRHQSRQAAAELGKSEPELNLNIPIQQQDDLDDSYDLFTGGRAISESLQLDRPLPATKDQAATVDIKSIDGITVTEMDWQTKTKGLSPQLDVLANLIPADQHAIFLPSFDALSSLLTEAQGSRLPMVVRAMAQPQDTMTLDRYQHQLCVSLNGLAQIIGPKLVTSIAITGSDPYLPIGSDLTLIFQSNDPAALQSLLQAQITLAQQTNPNAKPIDAKLGQTHYTGATSPDRSISTFLASFGNAVVLTNSLPQLQRIAAVQKGTEPSLAKQPEYTFFRDRYKLGEEDETALLVLSDATIRRWCGPRWRIANSRRIRAAAVMSEMQATYLDTLVQGNVKPGPIYSDLHLTDLGDLSLTPTGVNSSLYGSLNQMTPISELPMETVTQSEADSYKSWRDRYEQNWRWFFDPIAVKFSITPKKLAADVTVMPLIWGSDYREMVAIAQGVNFPPDAGDPHDALLHLILAINRKAVMEQTGENFVTNMVPGLKADPFSWLGKSISLYADDDPFWDDLAKSKNNSEFMEANIGRLPLALRADVTNGLELAGFLVSLHAFVEQSAPQMTIWQNLTYKDHAYVKISPSEMAKTQTKEITNLVIYYAATGQSLLITPNEDLLKRALDREIATTQQAAAPTTQPWLGSSVALRANAKLFDILMRADQKDLQRITQSQAWKNIPILNEWKRRYPNQDPTKLEEQLWGTRLLDPAAGQYIWNEKYQTMESPTYGQPASPKDGPTEINNWTELKKAAFGLTFEDQGVRARAQLDVENPK